ncbi:MAG: metallophosphoesterase family protein [Caldicoprobacterales bacterium]|jgi:putative phosphoesterase|nr:metallophosphoesterase family protein [Clostridiales bacterium]
MVIGIISDTHSKISKRALQALQGSDVIIHAGDIGNPEVLQLLEKIAPVYPVRGNTDLGIWAQSLPMSQMVEFEGKLFYVLHNIETLHIDPKSIGVDAVIYGHSHMPKAEIRDGILYFNPGSAGPRRFQLPVCVGRIRIVDKQFTTEWVNLE